MGTETLRWWRQLLEQLQQAASEASAAAGVGTAATPSWQPSNLEDIHDTINCLGGLPDKLPKAVWKKLVGFKVPHKLVLVCCQQPSTTRLMARLFAMASRCLMVQAADLCQDASINLVETFLQQLQQSQLLQYLATAVSDTTQRLWELQTWAESAVLAADLADPAYKHIQDLRPSSSRLHQLHLHTIQLCANVFNLHRLVDAASTRSSSSSHHWHQLLLPVAVPALELSVLTVQHVSSCLELLPAHVGSPSQPLWRAMMVARKVAQHATALCADDCSCCTSLRQQLMGSPYHLPAMCITLLVGVYGSLGRKEADAWLAANTPTTPSSSSGQLQEQKDQLMARWESAAWDLACSRHDVLPTSHYLLLQLADCSSKALLWTATSDNTTAEKDLSKTMRAVWLAAEGPMRSLLLQGGKSSKLVPGISAVFLSLPVLLHWAWYYLKDNPKEVTENSDSLVLGTLSQSAFAFRVVASAAARDQRQQERGQQRRRLRGQRQKLRLRLRQRQLARLAARGERQPQERGQQRRRLRGQRQLARLAARGERQPQKRGQQQRLLRRTQRLRLRLWQLQRTNVARQDKPSRFFFDVSAYLEVLDDVLMLTQKLLTLLLPVAAAHVQPAQAAGGSSSSSSSSGRRQTSSSAGGRHTGSSSTGGRQAGSSSTGKEQTSSSSTTPFHSTDGSPQSQFEVGMQTCLEGVVNACAHLSADHMTDLTGMQPPQQQQQRTAPPASRVCCADSVPSLREDAGVWLQHAAHLCRILEAYVREAARGLAAGGPLIVKEAAVELAYALVQLIDPRQSGLRGPLLQAAAAAGAGSTEQQQLLGLLRSMVKWVDMMGPQQQRLAEEVRVAVAAAAANMLLAAHRGQRAGAAGAGAGTVAVGGAGADAGAAAVIGAEASLGAAAEGGTASTGGAASSSSSHYTHGSCRQHAQSSVSTPPATQFAADRVLAYVPWLGLLGCCCLQWSQQLANLPSISARAAGAAAAQSGVLDFCGGVISELPGELCNIWGTAVYPVWGWKSLVMLCLHALDTWPGGLIFERGGGQSTAATELMRTLGAGYSTPVLAAMAAKHECVSRHQGLCRSVVSNPEEPVPIARFVQQPTALGEALGSVPHKQCCNNPACRNLSGPSELQLVKGRSNTCSVCRSACYCSDVCMKQHWKQHRLVCKALAATTAAAGGSDAKVAALQP